MDVVAELLRRWRPRRLAEDLLVPVDRLCSHDYRIPSVTDGVDPPETRRQEMEWLRTYERELEMRLRALATEFDGVGHRTRGTGH